MHDKAAMSPKSVWPGDVPHRNLVRSGLQTRGLRIAHDFVLRFVKPDDLERWKLCMAVIVKVVDALKLFVRFVLPRRSF